MYDAVRATTAGLRERQATAELETSHRRIGDLLRELRERRRLSQLAFSLQAGVSARHLSFIETGRSQPSREMILHLAEQLEAPLRERNQMLLAAGYAPAYVERPLSAPQMAAVREAVRQVLARHEPYPALVVDRMWTLVDANESLSIFTEDIAPELLAAPINCMRLALHPQGLAPRIVNLGEWRVHLLTRLRRVIARTDDPAFLALYDELAAYPCDQPEPTIEYPGAHEIFAPLRLSYHGAELRFFSMIATFGSALDITVSELSIESFFPADDATAEALHRRARRAGKMRPDD